MDTNENNERVSVSNEELLADVIESEKKAKQEDNTENVDKKNKKDKTKKKEVKGTAKKLKHGTMATVLTCVFIALVVLVNVVTTMIFDRYPISIDLTQNKIYSVTDKTEKYVKSIDTDVLVTVFADEETFEGYNSYTKQASELLKNYSKLNHHITYRFVDIDSNPEITKDYETTPSQFEIYFETSADADGKEIKRVKSVGMVDLVKFNDEFLSQMSESGYSIDMLTEQYGDLNVLYYYGGYVESSNAEQAFTSALMTVTDPNPVYVTMITGSNELTALTYFQSLLEANGYDVNSIDITSQDIPEETDVIVIPAPRADYTPEDVQKLSDFLNNGGDLGKQMIYVASYGQEETPNLDEFLAEYGISVGEGVICEKDAARYYNEPCTTLVDTVSENFTQDVQSDAPKIMSTLCRPVNVLFDEQGMNVCEAYLTSTSSAYTAQISVSTMTGEIAVGDALAKGAQNYAVMGSKAKFTDDNDTVYSNVLVLGSEALLSDYYLQFNRYQNSEYFVSVLNGMTGKTTIDGLTIQPKSITGNAFDINESQKSRLKWTFCLIIPVCVLVVGIVVWVRRKNR
ncbi:MAG: Gldg family protein [Ruminococcus sp.]|nr:Gldg family protein [Ruminococcus sp.]